jgi:hypothetical protein
MQFDIFFLFPNTEVSFAGEADEQTWVVTHCKNFGTDDCGFDSLNVFTVFFFVTLQCCIVTVRIPSEINVKN